MPPSDLTLTPRLIYLQDLAVTTNPAGETASVNVLGAATNPTTLTKIGLIQLSDLEQAANDVGAAAAGVPVGQHYYNTTYGKPHTRLS
jgi:hypothetical protein